MLKSLSHQFGLLYIIWLRSATLAELKGIARDQRKFQMR